ncbi:DEAD box ATP-dependent RNA helicase, putative, partial [Entamoeba invadens IP1]
MSYRERSRSRERYQYDDRRRSRSRDRYDDRYDDRYKDDHRSDNRYNDRRDTRYDDRRDDRRDYRPQNNVVNRYENISQKKLEPINFDLNVLPPIKKDFSDTFVQNPNTNIAEYLKNNLVTVKGDETPKVIFSFDDVKFPDFVKNVFAEQKFTNPTPIQAVGWPIVLGGTDVVGVAETGSGKTISYLLPGIVHLLNKPLAQSREGPTVLILAPTRELVSQIEDEARKFTKGSGIKIASVFGGAPSRMQMGKPEKRNAPFWVIDELIECSTWV